MERMPLNWFAGIPPITRIWSVAALITSILIDTKLVKSSTIIWLPSTFKKKEYWRLVTCFFYFGEFNVDLFMILYNISQYSRQLEESFVKTKNYLWFLLINCSLLILYSMYVKNSYILGPNLVEILTYVWGRKNPDVQMGFLGLIEFRAGYYALFTIVYSMFRRQSFSSIWGDLPILLIAHLVFYFDEVFSKVHGINPLSPPWEWNVFQRRVRLEE